MKLLVGLGNPGEKYQNNRHNVGFMFIDYLAKLLHYQIVKKEKLFITMKSTDDTQAIQSNTKTYVLAKSNTYMNKSGEAVHALVKKYSINPLEDLIIIHDDLDIPLGKFKIQKGTGPKLHNGLESIENYLHIKDFLRIRIGVDARTTQTWIDGETYVLDNFTKEEIQKLSKILSEIHHYPLLND